MGARKTGEAQRVAVVGSGISGLSAALRLEQAGHDVELIERDPVLGGRFGVGKLGDKQVMMGGKNIGRKYSAFRSFTAALGSYPWEPFGINQSFMKDDEVLTIDSTRRGSSLNNIRRMATPRDLARLGLLAARIRLDDTNRFLGSSYFTALSSSHDHVPLSGHFSPKVTKTLLRPITVRMNGAEPDEVYLGTFGTNLSLLMDTYDQLTGGIQPALEALSRRVTVRLGTMVEGLVMRDGAAVGLRLSTDGVDSERSYDGIVIATPAYATADIVLSEMPWLSKRLSEVRYFGSSVVLVEYDRPIFTPEVRALAINDNGPCSNAGSYAMESRHIVRYTYSGRPGRIGDQEQATLDDWVGETEERLVRYLGASRAKRVTTGGRTWNAAYCAYLPFHGEFLREVAQAVAGVPGLELAGDYLLGVSLESCCRSGRNAGDRMIEAIGAPIPVRTGR
ncbi:NAD(P)/FAD-dependent oxidoreductase [Frankia sp. Cj3]|uniref:protoporphyrinogen/coproporphyrinogen oxidase n=1 Tax=Frankia sp. Cj3 TaxID=2880976 RepID=UPI002103BC6E|nr:FAD-dependent oxidoreductase [Frankia sp. Cj3]